MLSKYATNIVWTAYSQPMKPADEKTKDWLTNQLPAPINSMQPRESFSGTWSVNRGQEYHRISFFPALFPNTEKDLNKWTPTGLQMNVKRISTLRQGNKNRNTKKSTSTRLNVFNAWRDDPSRKEWFLKDIPFVEHVLCKFFVEVREKNDGKNMFGCAKVVGKSVYCSS